MNLKANTLPAFYSRCLLALDLARATHNAEAALLLEKFIEHMSAVDAQNCLQSISRLFIQALYLENPDLAIYRLVYYLHEHKLFDKDDHNPVKAISLILEFIDPVYGEHPECGIYETDYKIFKQIIEILLENNGLSMLYSVYQSDKCPELFRNSIFYCILLNEINEDRFESAHFSFFKPIENKKEIIDGMREYLKREYMKKLQPDQSAPDIIVVPQKAIFSMA